jgi:hypothetical protein
MVKKQATVVRRKPLGHMSPTEVRAWLRATRVALQQKMQRERAYLDRRAARGTYTPTDEAYEGDQLLEADVLALLDEMEASLPDGKES